MPPEIWEQAPVVAVILWIGIQSRREVIQRFDKITDRLDAVLVELVAVARDRNGAQVRPKSDPSSRPEPPLA